MLEVSYPTEHAEYHLTHALLFYHSGNTTMATVHKVQNRQLLAGKSISIADVEELFHSENQHQKMQFLPPEVIAWSRNEVIWFEKSRIRPIYFNVPEPQRQFLNKISGKNVIWPSLIFRISRKQIFCWAVKSRTRPDLDTKLYNAPFTNIFTSHCFCPPVQFQEIRDENMIDFARKATDLFFLGHFSHLYGNMLDSITYSRGRDRFWEKMASMILTVSFGSPMNAVLILPAFGKAKNCRKVEKVFRISSEQQPASGLSTMSWGLYAIASMRLFTIFI